MLNIDAKKGKLKADGSLIDVVSDIALAVFEVTHQIALSNNQDYDDALEYLLSSIRHATKSAYKEEQNGTFD